MKLANVFCFILFVLFFSASSASAIVPVRPDGACGQLGVVDGVGLTDDILEFSSLDSLVTPLDSIIVNLSTKRALAFFRANFDGEQWGILLNVKKLKFKEITDKKTGKPYLQIYIKLKAPKGGPVVNAEFKILYDVESNRLGGYRHLVDGDLIKAKVKLKLDPRRCYNCTKTKAKHKHPENFEVWSGFGHEICDSDGYSFAS